MVQKLKKEIKYSERVIAANNDEIVKKDTEITSLKQALAVANNETTNRKNVSKKHLKRRAFVDTMSLFFIMTKRKLNQFKLC